MVKIERAERRKIRINASKHFFENKDYIKRKWNENRIKKSTPLKYQIQNKIIKKEIKSNYIGEEKKISAVTYIPPKKEETIEEKKSDIEILIEEETNRGLPEIEEEMRKHLTIVGNSKLFRRAIESYCDNLFYGAHRDDPYDSETYKGSILSGNNIQ